MTHNKSYIGGWMQHSDTTIEMGCGRIIYVKQKNGRHENLLIQLHTKKCDICKENKKIIEIPDDGMVYKTYK